jgi:hypothetical protein
MHYGRVTKACTFVIALGPDPFREPLVWTRSMCLSRLIARGCSDAYCTDHRRGDRVRPQAAFRVHTLRRDRLYVKGFRSSVTLALSRCDLDAR